MLLSDVGNESGLVGKNLMFAALAGGYGRYPVDHPRFGEGPLALPFIDRSVDDFYVAPKESGLAYRKAGTIVFQLPHKNPIFQTEKLARTAEGPLFGAALKAKMRRYFLETRTIEWEAFSEFLPHPGCAVTLDPTQRDRFGLRVARVALATHPASRAASDYLATKGSAVMQASGAL